MTLFPNSEQERINPYGFTDDAIKQVREAARKLKEQAKQICKESIRNIIYSEGTIESSLDCADLESYVEDKKLSRADLDTIRNEVWSEFRQVAAQFKKAHLEEIDRSCPISPEGERRLNDLAKKLHLGAAAVKQIKRNASFSLEDGPEPASKAVMGDETLSHVPPNVEEWAESVAPTVSVPVVLEEPQPAVVGETRQTPPVVIEKLHEPETRPVSPHPFVKEIQEIDQIPTNESAVAKPESVPLTPKPRAGWLNWSIWLGGSVVVLGGAIAFIAGTNHILKPAAVPGVQGMGSVPSSVMQPQVEAVEELASWQSAKEQGIEHAENKRWQDAIAAVENVPTHSEFYKTEIQPLLNDWYEEIISNAKELRNQAKLEEATNLLNLIPLGAERRDEAQGLLAQYRNELGLLNEANASLTSGEMVTARARLNELFQQKVPYADLEILDGGRSIAGILQEGNISDSSGIGEQSENEAEYNSDLEIWEDRNEETPTPGPRNIAQPCVDGMASC